MRGNTSEKLTEAGYNQEKETEASILSTSQWRLLFLDEREESMSKLEFSPEKSLCQPIVTVHFPGGFP